MAKVTVTFDHDVPNEVYGPIINWGPLKALCREYVDNLAAGKRPASDAMHYIYEEALVATYGEDVWKFVNERVEYCE